MSSMSLASSIATFLSTGIAILVELAFLIVALTAVRTKNAGAGGFIAAGAGVLLVVSLLYPLLSSVMSAAMRGSGDVMMGYALLNVTMAIFRAAGSALIIVGIVKLANGPEAPSPYR